MPEHRSWDFLPGERDCFGSCWVSHRAACRKQIQAAKMEGNGHNRHPKPVKVGKTDPPRGSPGSAALPAPAAGFWHCPRVSQDRPLQRVPGAGAVTPLPEDSASGLDQLQSPFKFCQPAPGHRPRWGQAHARIASCHRRPEILPASSFWIWAPQDGTAPSQPGETRELNKPT